MMTRDVLLAALQNKLGTTEAEEVMQWVDAYVADLPAPTIWTAEQVALVLGLKNANSARAVLSRAGIPGTRLEGKVRYPANLVRELHARRKASR